MSVKPWSLYMCFPYGFQSYFIRTSVQIEKRSDWLSLFFFWLFFLICCFLSNQILDFWKVIAENLSEEEIKGLKQMFNNMDTDKSGTITLDELKTGLSRLGSKLTEIEIKQLMDAVSTVKLSHYLVISLFTETNKLFIVIYIAH